MLFCFYTKFLLFSQVISPSQFWVVIEQDFERVVSLTRFIQDHLTAIPLPPSKLFPNVLCLAPFEGTYYRAKVLRADSSRNPNAKSLVSCLCNFKHLSHELFNIKFSCQIDMLIIIYCVLM